MNRDYAALEMAKALMPQIGERYQTFGDLMDDAFLAADCFVGRARQDTKESPGTASNTGRASVPQIAADRIRDVNDLIGGHDLLGALRLLREIQLQLRTCQ